MKLFSRSPNGLMLKIGNTPQTAEWYTVPPIIKATADAIKIPTEGVEVTIDGPKTGLRFIAVGKVDVPAPVEEKTESVVEPVKPAVHHNGGRPEYKERKFDSETSVKQTCVQSTSRALIALQGHISPANIDEMIDKLYTKFSSLFK